MKIPAKGFASGYKTEGLAYLAVVAMWCAYAFDAPVFGQEPVGLGETIAATIVALLVIFQRRGTKKAERAAREANGVVAPLLALCLVLPFIGCTGKIARDRVLAPAVILAADGVETDVMQGIDDAEEDGDATAIEAHNLRIKGATLWFAIRDRDREAVAELLPLWVELKPYAVRGVEALRDEGLIGPLGEQSRLERIRLFDEALMRLSERT